MVSRKFALGQSLVNEGAYSPLGIQNTWYGIELSLKSATRFGGGKKYSTLDPSDFWFPSTRRGIQQSSRHSALPTLPGPRHRADFRYHYNCLTTQRQDKKQQGQMKQGQKLIVRDYLLGMVEGSKHSVSAQGTAYRLYTTTRRSENHRSERVQQESGK